MDSLIANYQFLALEWPWLGAFVKTFLKSSALLVLACVFSLLCRNKPASLRHLIWFAVLLAIMLLPVLEKFVPEVEFAVLPQASVHVSTFLVEGVSSFLLQITGNALYWTASTLTLLILLFSFWQAMQIIRLTSNAEQITDKRVIPILEKIKSREDTVRNIRLLQSNQVSSPVSWGFLAPVILFPNTVNEWSEEMIRSVLEHELSHIERLDWLTLVFGTMARAIYWYNPLVWFAFHRMNEDAELACDDAALLEQDNHIYAETLISLAREYKTAGDRIALVKAMAQTFLNRRILTVLDNKLRRIRSEGLFLIRAAIVSISLGTIVASVTFVSAKEQGFGPVTISLTQSVEQVISRNLTETETNTRADTELPEKPSPITITTVPVTETVLRVSDLAAYRQQQIVNEFGEVPVIALEELRHTENVTERQLVSRGVPKYPDRARLTGKEGYVVIRYQVNGAGITYNPEVLESEPEKVFNRAALKALEEYRFLPDVVARAEEINDFYTTRFIFELEPDPG